MRWERLLVGFAGGVVGGVLMPNFFSALFTMVSAGDFFGL